MSTRQSAAPNVDALLLHRYDRPGPRYTSYPTAVEFHDGVNADVYNGALAKVGRAGEAVSLYTHLPFCEQRCLYCACNVVITQRKDVAGAYLQRLNREIEIVSGVLGKGHEVSQFHFGGGTPTYFTPDELCSLMGKIRHHFRFEKGAELGVEVDPRVTTVEHLAALADEGFNRLSLGVQDFDPSVQTAVQRIQTFADTKELVDASRRLGFASINIDLIYGLPLQNVPSFQRTLDQVISLGPDRLAVYSFALVPWLKPHQKLLPQHSIPAGLDKLELLVAAREKLLAAGFVDIGMDHFALPGDELAVAQRERRLSRNFMGYTTTRAGDLIGLGMSAIGFVAGTYVQNEKKLSRYGDALEQDRLPVERGFILGNDDLVRQHVIREWMCNFAIDKVEVSRKFAVAFDDYFRLELDELRRLSDEGFVEMGGDLLTAGPLGRLFPRNVAMVFDRYLRGRRAKGPAFSRTV